MNITNTNDTTNKNIYALIVGSSGVGKTSLAKSLNHDETLILSAESGLLSIADANIDVIEINNYENLLAAFNFIAKGTKYKNYKHEGKLCKIFTQRKK